MSVIKPSYNKQPQITTSYVSVIIQKSTREVTVTWKHLQLAEHIVQCTVNLTPRTTTEVKLNIVYQHDINISAINIIWIYESKIYKNAIVGHNQPIAMSRNSAVC